MQIPSILFFKTLNTTDTIYERRLCLSSQQTPDTISFKSFQPDDVSFIHRWINTPYSEKFWQLKGYSEEMLQKQYAQIMVAPDRYTLIGYYNHKPVCEIDVYLVAHSELAPYITNPKTEDCGIHFLMAPPRETFKGLSVIMLRAFMGLYFSHPLAGDLYAEPDELNALANLLAKRAGFSLLRKANLPEKIANLYRITKQVFLAQPLFINAT